MSKVADYDFCPVSGTALAIVTEYCQRHIFDMARPVELSPLNLQLVFFTWFGARPCFQTHGPSHSQCGQATQALASRRDSPEAGNLLHRFFRASKNKPSFDY